MNAKQFSSMLAVMFSPAIVSTVAQSLGIDEVEAARRYFTSRVYAALSDESSKVWHYSPQLLGSLLVDEIRTGVVEWPEEAC